MGRFLITNFISLIDLGLVRFSISSVNFGNLYLSRNVSILAELSDLKKLFIISPCYPLNIYRICNDVPLFFIQCGVLWGGGLLGEGRKN